MKSFGKGSGKQVEKHFRTKYIDHSRRFVDWVDSLGFEQTPIGRLAHRLDQRFGIRRASLLFLFSLCLSFLLFYDFEFGYNIKVGDVASTDIKSPLSFTVIDEVATEAKRREAEVATPPVFDFYPDVYEQVFDRAYKAFGRMRGLARNTKWPRNEKKKAEVTKDFLRHKKEFEDLLGVEVPTREFEWLVNRRFSAHFENVIIETLARWSKHKIAEGPDNVLKPEDEQIIVRQVEVDVPGEEFTLDRMEIRGLRKRSDFTLDGIPQARSLSQKSKRNVQRLAHAMLVPNLTFNRQETEDRRRKARASVLPVQISIQKIKPSSAPGL